MDTQIASLCNVMPTYLPVYHSVLIMSAFNQEKALVGAFSVIVKLQIS